MKKILIGILVLSGCMLLYQCRIYNHVIVNKKASVDFNAYRTFAWLPDFADSCNSPYNNEVIRNNLRSYIAKSFLMRGYSLRVDSPDVLLQLSVVNQKVTDQVTYFPADTKYFSGNDYYNPVPENNYYMYTDVYCYPMGYCVAKIEYVKGALSLDVIDRKSNQVVWACTVEGDMYDKNLGNKEIHPAVKAIMKRYPVKKRR